MTVGEKILSLRQEKGISQEKLAEAIGVSRQAVARWEGGQSIPDLPKLISLSDFFSVSLDRLIKENEYDELRFRSEPSLFSDKEIIRFLIKAKQSTYAAKGAEVKSSRPASHDLRYSEGDLIYWDTYLGGDRFAGEEALWKRDIPFWAMNYAGRVLDDAFSGDFLKEALLNVPFENPFRGPSLYRSGEYTYHCSSTGDFSWFEGKEEIFNKRRKVYECRFHGGKIL